jgi:hypothetical protein
MSDLPSVPRPYCPSWVDGLRLSYPRPPLDIVLIDGMGLCLERLICDPTYTISNSLLREIDSLRSKYYALRLANIRYNDIIVSISILFIIIRYG